MAMVDVGTLDGSEHFQAYVTRPDGEPRAAIIVIQEIFGVNSGIRRKCDKWAEQGYLAVAPDLFWRLEPGVELDPDVEPEFKHALDLMNRFDQDQGVRDIEATIHFAREQLGEGGRVGCVGYCLGGRLAFMTAARTDVDASVGYYAVAVDNLLGEKEAIDKPLLLHIAGDDGFVPPETQRKMRQGLDDHPMVTLFDYPGEDHGFAAEMGKRRSEEAARLADQRTAEFFERNLA
ncbi:MAG TPA: dienelactone hydrolase family protein [Allosphingosinicella sp.]|nr:dienelactone hydrolase family protein [Allosphingosinicella sp.]